MKKKIAVYANGWGAENLTVFLKGIESILFPENIDTFTFLSFNFFAMSKADEDGETSIFELGDIEDFDGAIVFSNGLNNPLYAEKIVKKAIKAEKPVVSLGIRFPGASYVSTNNVVGMEELSEHLVNEHNVRKAVFLAGNEGNHDSDERMNCLKAALSKVGETISSVYYTNWGTDRAIKYVDKYCSKKEDLPDAIVCANDFLALAVCYELEKIGIQVPEDVLVTGYDGTRDGMTFYPSLATVVQDYFRQGAACASIILEQIKSGKPEAVEHLIDSEFYAGESCGCLNARDSRHDRDNACRRYYAERTEKVFYNDHLNLMESTLYTCSSIPQIKEIMTDFFAKNHDFEGNNFWIMGERSYGTSIYNDEVKMRRRMYSDELRVVVAIENGEPKSYDTIERKVLVPNYESQSGVHNYFFIPVHSGDILYGYLVMEDVYKLINDFSLEVYRRAIRNALDKYRQSMKLEYLNKKLMELYTRDSLTGLYNRFGYECLAIPMFKEAVEKKNSCAVIFMDINRMKYINDNFGHLQGDLAIRTIANAIITETPPEWIGIRYGGDEYLIIGECSHEEEAKALQDKLMAGVANQVSKMSLPFDLTVSSGYIMTDPESSYTLAEYIQRADDVMYEQKKRSYEKDNYKR